MLETVPAPQKLAPHALAMTADVLEDAATGRFVLLHDPAGQEGWGGQWRCVTFARAAIDLEMASDPLLPEIGWAWLLESLKKHGCEFINPSGTVTRVASASFGELVERDFAARKLQPTSQTLTVWPQAKQLAQQFWQSVAADTRVSDAFKVLAQANADVVAKL